MRPFMLILLFTAAALLAGTAQAQCSNGSCAPVAKTKSVLVNSTRSISKTVVRTRKAVRARRVRLFRRSRG